MKVAIFFRKNSSQDTWGVHWLVALDRADMRRFRCNAAGREDGYTTNIGVYVEDSDYLYVGNWCLCLPLSILGRGFRPSLSARHIACHGSHDDAVVNTARIIIGLVEFCQTHSIPLILEYADTYLN